MKVDGEEAWKVSRARRESEKAPDEARSASSGTTMLIGTSTRATNTIYSLGR